LHGSCDGHGNCKCVSRLLPSPQRCTTQRKAVPFGHVMTNATHVMTRGILPRKVGLLLAQVMAWSATMLACCGEASSAGPRPPAPDPVTWAQLWLHRAPVSKEFGNAVRGAGALSVRSWAARVSSGVAECMGAVWCTVVCGVYGEPCKHDGSGTTRLAAPRDVVVAETAVSTCISSAKRR